MRRRKYRLRIGRQQNNNLLVVILTLIVIFETTLLLFLLPSKKVTKPSLVTKKPAVAVKKTTSKAYERKYLIKKQKQTPVARLNFIPKIPKITVPTKIKGKIAIVIDDWGYSTNNLDTLSQIQYPLTLAILPFRDYSRKIADFAHLHNYEVIIHMPMEPEYKEKVDLEPQTLMTSMNESTIKKILNDAFKDIPYAKGVNNHMGSLATQDEDFIETVFNELKKKNYYFLDSLATAKSVGYKISKKIGIKFTKRSIFLDNEPKPDYIKNQLMELAKKAEEDGQAIGIGHDRDDTLNALKKEIPKLAKEGYEFVFVSELAE